MLFIYIFITNYDIFFKIALLKKNVFYKNVKKIINGVLE